MKTLTFYKIQNRRDNNCYSIVGKTKKEVESKFKQLLSEGLERSDYYEKIGDPTILIKKIEYTISGNGLLDLYFIAKYTEDGGYEKIIKTYPLKF